MKNFLTAFYNFLYECGKVKAASQLARMGLYDEARAVMNSK